MTWLFSICAVIGGTVLVCQFVLTLVGIGGDQFDMPDDIPDDLPGDAGFDGHVASAHGADGAGHDAGGHHGSTWLFGVISFRTVVAALAFFGLTGMAAQAAEQPLGVQLLLAGAAGVAAMYGVHWLGRLMGRLGEDGTSRIRLALGKEGTVYVPIPPAKEQAGKIQLSLNNRLVEYEAVTSAGQKLATGTKVRVVGIAGNTLEVEPLQAGVV